MNTDEIDLTIATEILGYKIYNTGERPLICIDSSKSFPVLEPLPRYSTDKKIAFYLLGEVCQKFKWDITLRYRANKKIWSVGNQYVYQTGEDIALVICQAILQEFIPRFN